MTETRLVPQDSPSPSVNQNTISNSATSAAGHLALVPTWLPLDVAPGYNSAGGGGNGMSIGTISSNATGVFVPSNATMAGPHSSAEAHQGNDAFINQQVTEMAGLGGDGGTGNVAIGGGDSGNHAGSGGHGIFYGGLVSTDVGVFAPVNVAVAGGPGSTAHAEQANNAAFLQGATQVGGIGGSGGDHNYAGGGPSLSHGTSLTFTGDNYAGHGGDGYFVGTMIDVNLAIFSPINIAIGAAGGSATARQTNNVIFDQGGIQIAGIGGDGGGFNMSSDTIFTGDHMGGGGGSGYSNGAMVDVSVGYFHPINIAVPAGGTADAEQIDHVLLDQHTLQMGGIGGLGGEGNHVSDANTALVDDVLNFLHS